MANRPAGPPCTGRVPLRDDDRQMIRDADGKVQTRPCDNTAVAGGTVCTMHGGAAPQVAAKAAVRAEVQAWGLGDATVDPGEILLRLVSQSARRAERYAAELEAHVAESDNLRAALVAQAWGEFGPTGEYIRGLAMVEAQERDRCATFAAKAVAAGLAERTVRLAERQGDIIADLVLALFDDLDLSDEQREAAPDVIRRHLTLLAS